MGKKVDITGERYGRLTAIEPTDERTKSGGIKWLFRCDCGTKKIISTNSVRSGRVTSCGCAQMKHGMAGTRIHNIWVDMRQRCKNPKYPEYAYYGGRGIRVCEDWDRDFSLFKDWALLNGYTERLSIDRIDVNGNYEPANCRWVSAKEQNRNTRANRYVTISGETKIISDWCAIYGISSCTVYRRVREMGMSFEQAITTPNLKKKAPNKTLPPERLAAMMEEWERKDKHSDEN